MEYLTIHQQNEMLQGFVSGEEALMMESIPEATLKKHLQWLLANATGMNIPEPVFFRRSVRFLSLSLSLLPEVSIWRVINPDCISSRCRSQWQNNKWVRGSYNSYLRTQGTLTNRSALTQPAYISGKPVRLSFHMLILSFIYNNRKSDPEERG